jgi:predicted transcriptional regulator
MEFLTQLVAGAKQDEHSRQALLSSLRCAVQELEQPQDIFWRMILEPQAYAVLRCATELQLFQLLQGHTVTTAAELAERSGAEVLLITRFMRVLAAMGIVTEVGVQQYANAPPGELLATQPVMCGVLNHTYVPAIIR